MAKQRWATFSVADHLDVRSLVADVMLFDRLAFPYPSDAREWRRWEEKKWDPRQLDRCLTRLGNLAVPFEWGDEQHRQFSTNMEQAAILERLTLAPAAGVEGNEQQKWEQAQQMTRMMIAHIAQGKRGTDFWVMPSYRSPAAFQADQGVEIAAADRRSRREALALLVGQEMALPDDADPGVALGLAVDLAGDEAYQKSRRALYNWQEDVVQREQSSQDDAQDLADLVSDLDKHVTAAAAKTRRQWLFFALKRIVGAAEALHNPFAAGSALIESVEFLGDRRREVPPGAIAAFHHVQRRVIDPSRPRRPWWSRRRQ